jgi:hypothetical protein
MKRNRVKGKIKETQAMMRRSPKVSGSMFHRLGVWFHERKTDKELIEHVVETVDPKIRLASAYRKRLQGPIQNCLEHCKTMVATIPGPIPLNKDNFDADPLIHAVFIGAISLKDLLAKEERTTGVVIPEGSQRYALLTMVHRESIIFGPKIQGDMIMRDAQMKSVTFTEHKIAGLSTTFESTKLQLEQLCFQLILEAISTELATKRTSLGELRKHLERLHAMSHMLSNGNNKKNAFGQNHPVDSAKLKEVEEALKSSEDEFAKASGGQDKPEDWLTILADHLTAPEQIMDIQKISMRLDWMNVLTEAADEKANELTFAQCRFTGDDTRDAIFIAY